MFKKFCIIALASLACYLPIQNAFALLGSGRTNFPGGFSNGVTIRGVPISITHPGSVWWVGSTTAHSASDGNSGTIERPFATISQALSKAGTSTGDVIYLHPRTYQSVSAAAGLVLMRPSVAIIGLGYGSDQPVIVYGTNTADVDVTGNNITVKNVHFDMTAPITLTNGIDVDAGYFTLEDCRITQSDSAGTATTAISLGTSSSFASIINCDFIAPQAGSDQAILFENASSVGDISIIGNRISGNYDNACISDGAVVGQAFSRVLIADNYLQNDQEGDHAIEFQGTSTGHISRNMIVVNNANIAIDPGNCGYFENYVGTQSATAIVVP
jgi:hypothetical protein